MAPAIITPFTLIIDEFSRILTNKYFIYSDMQNIWDDIKTEFKDESNSKWFYSFFNEKNI